MFILTSIFTMLNRFIGWFVLLYNMIPTPIKKILNWVLFGIIIFFTGLMYLKYKENQAYNEATINFNQKQILLQKEEIKKFQDEISKMNTEKNILDQQILVLDKKIDSMEKNIIIYINKYKDVTLDPLFNNVLNQMHRRNK